MTTENKSGWWLPLNSKKAHYIVSNRSLCGTWGYLGDGSSLEDKNHDSTDNCGGCRKRYYAMIGRPVPTTAKERMLAKHWSGCDSCVRDSEGALAQPCARCLVQFGKIGKILDRIKQEDDFNGK